MWGLGLPMREKNRRTYSNDLIVTGYRFLFVVLKKQEKKDMAVHTRQDLFALYLFLFHGMDQACLYPEILGDADCMALVDG